MPIAHETVSFDELVSHRYGSADEQAAFADLYKMFERDYGTIVDEYWCSGLTGAAVVTDRLQLYCSVARVDAPEYDGLSRRLSRSVSSATKAHRMLKGEDLRSAQEIFFDGTTEGLDLLGEVVRRREAGDPPFRDEEVVQAFARIDDRLQEGHNVYEQAAQRTAQSQYLLGVLFATAAVALLCGLVAVVSRILGFDAAAVPGIVAAGSAGALLSVLTRITSGSLILQHEAGIPMLRLLGAVRPVVGTIAGLAVCVLAASGLIPLKVPPSPADETLFFVGIAFLSGFSERWAQDMLAAGQGRAGPTP